MANKTFKNEILQNAVRCGFLSDNPTALNYHVHYQYLGMVDNQLEFRHIKNGGSIIFSLKLITGLSERFKPAAEFKFKFTDKDADLIEAGLIALSVSKPEKLQEIEGLIEYIHKQRRELN